MMSRTFSRREKILFLFLALLIIGYAYYAVVWTPATETIARCEGQVADIDVQISTEIIRLTQLNKMKAEIEEYKAAGKNAKEIPLYNNQQRIISELNTVLGSSESYDVSFSAVTFNENIAMHPIKISFTANSYQSARQIVNRLQNSAFVCKVSALSLSSGRGVETPNIADGMVQAQLTVTFFEYAPDIAEGNK